eukprot:TRINITY_DN9499_c0_g1_i1.p1 TRINITY_DN9499_c0_g1~~TRINITY_DN9499_c0_g1_i1.p1  ORF type:complete len:545 (+),score=140.14 TRINITY_DN9499_c0_g1_i1:99-1637(+)
MLPSAFVSLAGVDTRRLAPLRPSRAGTSPNLVTTLRLPATDVTLRRDPRGDVGVVFNGAMLDSVAPGSPAERAGLQRLCGRTVSHVNGQPVMTLADIYAAAAWDAENVTLRFAAQTVAAPASPFNSSGILAEAAPLGALPSYAASEAERLRAGVPPRPPHAPPLLDTVAPRAPAGSSELLVDKGEGESLGLLLHDMVVTDADPGSPASQRGAKRFAGHVLTHINDVPVQSVDDVRVHSSPQRVLLRFSPPTVPQSQKEVHVRTPGPGERLGCKLTDMVLESIAPGTPAAESAAQGCIGMLLTHVQGTPVGCLEDIAEVLDGHSGDTVRLRFAQRRSDSWSSVHHTASTAAAASLAAPLAAPVSVQGPPHAPAFHPPPPASPASGGPPPLGTVVAVDALAGRDLGVPQGTRGTVRGYRRRPQAAGGAAEIFAAVELDHPLGLAYVRPEYLVVLIGAGTPPRGSSRTVSPTRASSPYGSALSPPHRQQGLPLWAEEMPVFDTPVTPISMIPRRF